MSKAVDNPMGKPSANPAVKPSAYPAGKPSVNPAGKDSYRAFVYKPYYYYFEDTPYFESRYIAKNPPTKKIKEPVRTITLKDGSVIEAFGSRQYYGLGFIILCITLIYFFIKKYC